jgi:putative transcriptional regulator
VTTLEAHLLIAAPELAEPFTKSVVLLVKHNEDGALGLILNRRTPADFQEVWSKVSDVPCQQSAPLYLGGPCEGPLVALHTQEFLHEIEVLPGLYFSSSKEKLETLAAQSPDSQAPVKFFAGYSGWSGGQLEHEIARGSWSVMPAKLEHAFWHEDELWKRANRFVSDAAWRAALGIAQAPPDLRAN